jgi:hypothetical protein
LPRAAALNEPRFGAGSRLTTGRANACCGGTLARAPLDPIMLARVGLMLLNECTGVMRPICCGET